MAKAKPPAIVNLEDEEEDYNFLIYGDSGVGKTVFGASGDNVLILRTEKGTVSAKRMGMKADLWRINDWSDLQEAFAYLAKNNHGYRWITIDSITELQAKCKRFIIERAIEKKPDHAPDNLELQDYVPYYELWKKTIRSFCELPANTLFIALEMKKENEEGDPKVMPDVEGKDYALSQWTCAQMTCVGHMKVTRTKEKETTRRISFRTVPPYFGKDRLQVFGRYIYDHDLNDVTTLLDGGTVDKGDEVAQRRASKSSNKKKQTVKAASADEEDNEDA